MKRTQIEMLIGELNIIIVLNILTIIYTNSVQGRRGPWASCVMNVIISSGNLGCSPPAAHTPWRFRTFDYLEEYLKRGKEEE